MAITIGIGAAVGGAVSALSNVKGVLQRISAATRDLKDKQSALGKEIQVAARLPRSDLAQLNAQYEKQKRLLDGLRNSTRALGQTQARLESERAKRGNLRGEMMGMGALAYMAAKPITVAIEFEASMSKVQSLTRLDKDSEEMKALAKQARELGASTSFTASEAAQAQGFLAMAGFKAEGIIKTMPHMLDLAKAGDMDLQRTADIASNIQTAFKVDDMQRVSDVLTMTFTTSNTNLEQLSEAMKYAAPAAQGLKISLEETAAMTGLLGNVGIQGSMAGTTLRNTFLNLSSPTSKAGAALKGLGVQTKDAQGNLRSMPELLYEISQAMEKQNMGTGDRAGVISSIFGTRATPGMIEMMTQAGGEGLKKYIQIVENSKGAAAATHKIMADNLQGDLKTLTSAWEELSISFVEGENSSLRDLVQTITGFLRNAAVWVQKNRELVSTGLKVAATLVSMKAGALVLGYGFSMLTTPVFKIIGIFQKFSAMRLIFQTGGLKAVFPLLFKVGQALMWLGRLLLANPLGIALGLLALAGYMLYRNWSDVVGGAKALWSDLGSFFSNLWGQVKTAFDGGIAGISALIINWSPLGIFYSAFASVLSWLGVDLPGKFTEFGSMIMQGLINGIKNSVTGVCEGVSTAIGGAIDSAKELLGIKSPSRVFAQIGGFTMEGLEQGLSSATSGPLAVVKNLAGTLATAGSIALAGSLPAMAASSFAAPDAEPFPAVKSLAETFAAAGSVAPVMSLPAMAASSSATPDTGPLSAVKSLAETLAAAGSAAPVVNLPAMAAPSFATPDAGPFSAIKSLAETFAAAGSVAPVVNLPAMAAPSFAAPDAGPLPAVKSLAETLAAADSVAPAMSLPVMASPNSTAPAGTGGASGGTANSTITVNVYPSPGMDEKALADLVAQKIEESQRRAAASRRSLLTDSD
ncbi:MAG: phage tail tape measure protein [Zoogloeaceae bacterium]|nr:phage tail tape measure protein [Zoogloeaceae bacterium]